MPGSEVSPFKDYLHRLHAELIGMTGGEVATYIPELARAAPDSFSISFATIDGNVYSVGDSGGAFSIQSVSKPFAYAGALRRLGQAAILERVGVEPTGEAFNSIVLDEKKNRPFNPMVNAGAIAIASLAEGETRDARVAGMQALFSEFAGRPLEMDDAVYRSEVETGHRNRAIAYLMLNSGMIDGDPEEVLDLYFRQCSLLVTTEDLALMGATLANNGVNPRTGKRLLGPIEVRDVLTLMMTCGMYDYAGEWSYDVGLPAKSGVSGGILAVLPGQLSIAIWSPPLDPIGNSVRGVAACRRISKDFGLHLFMNAAPVEDVVRRQTTADRQPSLRIRNPREREMLRVEGEKIALVELQGALYFASAERMIRQLEATVAAADFLIIDFRRLNSVDAAALRFFDDFLARTREGGLEIAFAEIGGGVVGATDMLAQLAGNNGVRVFQTVDEAIEIYEDMVLEATRQPYDHTRFALGSIDLFNGLDEAQLGKVEALIHPMQFEAGERVLTRGDHGQMFFVVARGSVSIMVPAGTADAMRVSCIGPGQFFGEMAVLGSGMRSADVIADERVVCYGITAGQLEALTQTDPHIVTVILANMAREFSARIRRGNEIISSLQ
ncbi:glutaminase A [Roseibacterium sp. SDUM158017]|uniref:glutaminase A n=1 Tax=Roseicyclus salinarum TaxID=3036773 RepID=UPI00241515AB|nr:glutaminase A [Roseibacterium sp. SDUM158017]MDG4649271.1 glutaminase A [Roseibacterium sp. SDUM158017]